MKSSYDQYHSSHVQYLYEHLIVWPFNIARICTDFCTMQSSTFAVLGTRLKAMSWWLELDWSRWYQWMILRVWAQFSEMLMLGSVSSVIRLCRLSGPMLAAWGPLTLIDTCAWCFFLLRPLCSTVLQDVTLIWVLCGTPLINYYLLAVNAFCLHSPLILF